jgi:hypothetical protein
VAPKDEKSKGKPMRSQRHNLGAKSHPPPRRRNKRAKKVPHAPPPPPLRDAAKAQLQGGCCGGCATPRPKRSEGSHSAVWNLKSQPQRGNPSPPLEQIQKCARCGAAKDFAATRRRPLLFPAKFIFSAQGAKEGGEKAPPCDSAGSGGARPCAQGAVRSPFLPPRKEGQLGGGQNGAPRFKDEETWGESLSRHFWKGSPLNRCGNRPRFSRSFAPKIEFGAKRTAFAAHPLCRRHATPCAKGHQLAAAIAAAAQKRVEFSRWLRPNNRSGPIL